MSNPTFEDFAEMITKGVQEALDMYPSSGQAAMFRLATAEVHAMLLQSYSIEMLSQQQAEANEQARLANIIAWTTANGAEPPHEVAQHIEERLGL